MTILVTKCMMRDQFEPEINWKLAERQVASSFAHGWRLTQ